MEKKDELIALTELTEKIQNIENYIMAQSIKTYTTKEVASILQVSLKTLDKFTKSKKLRGSRVNDIIRFTQQNLWNFLNENPLHKN